MSFLTLINLVVGGRGGRCHPWKGTAPSPRREAPCLCCLFFVPVGKSWGKNHFFEGCFPGEMRWRESQTRTEKAAWPSISLSTVSPGTAPYSACPQHHCHLSLSVPSIHVSSVSSGYFEACSDEGTGYGKLPGVVPSREIRTLASSSLPSIPLVGRRLVLEKIWYGLPDLITHFPGTS